MSAKSYLAALVLGMLALPACDRNSKTPQAQDTTKTAAEESPKVQPESPQQKSLKAAVRAFHEGLASADKEQQKKALAAILCTKKDIEAMFPGREQYWGILEIGTMGQADDTDKYAQDAAGRGAIKSISAIDLRTQGDRDASVVVSKIAKGLPAYRANIECEKDQVRLDPLIFVNDRWVWFPGLEKLCAAIPAADGP